MGQPAPQGAEGNNVAEEMAPADMTEQPNMPNMPQLPPTLEDGGRAEAAYEQVPTNGGMQ